MKNLEDRKGFANRHKTALPKKICLIKVITKDVDGEHTFSCEWNPFNQSQYSQSDMPAKGYLGTAKVIEGSSKGIGFHAWEQNNSEFIWYALI